MQHNIAPLAVVVALSTLTLAPWGCGGSSEPAPTAGPTPTEGAAKATPEEASAFAAEADRRLRETWIKSSLAAWDYQTNITPETEAASAKEQEAEMALLSELIPQAARFDGVEGMDPAVARQLKLLKIASPLPAPNNAERRAELASINTSLNGMYGAAKYCTGEGEAQKCRDLGDLEGVLASDRDWDAQLDAWSGWHSTAKPMREKYVRFVELGNEGAKEIGFADMGELWRSGYDMTPAEVEAEADRLWTQVKPLYEKLHCHTRAKLAEKYGPERVSPTGPIPAHLTGNMWAQSWENLYPMLEPYPGQPSLDVTKALQEQKWDPERMVRTSEGFFTSLGMKPLPQTFWERSMFVKPEGREVVCHASAWDPHLNGDARIKMCIQPDLDNLITIHHELGHDYYYLYYHHLPALFQTGAHDGFHEAVGDTLALSITPAYLHKLGLLEQTSEAPEAVVNKQMLDALQKISFLPFGRMIDQWRWDVFAGRVAPDQYNAHWWTLREKYQGVASPIPRTEADFDPGAKYHIPANTPYLRYFFSHVLQFQFHKALCDASGHQGPLHTCSIHGSEEAGKRLSAMLALGASKPWPDALEQLTGTRQMDAEPLIAYFKPLEAWLDEQNQGRQCGW